ncbi:MAG: proton-conducting transporter membrane subunit, partial [Rhodobacteraceae bacterium]|nr:proton-conducting transporter membrane subunit [Paracoccaceae bacterium]
MNNLISIMMFVPLTAAVVMMLFLRGDDEDAQKNVKYLTVITTLATFLISAFVFLEFNRLDSGFQLVEEAEWLFGLRYKVGIDGISILFVMLTTFLMPITVLACWDVTHRVKEFMAALLVLETFMIGVFCSLDLVLFYLFFEAGLIPMFLIIGIWGGKERIY